MASEVEPSPRKGGAPAHIHISSRSSHSDGRGVGSETRAHLSRTGSVDIFVVSPPRANQRGEIGGPEDRDATLFEGTMDTPDRRYLRVSTDATLRDSTTSVAGVQDYGRNTSRQISSVTTSSKAVLSALRALQDKIKRLEHERTAATEEVARLRRQVADLERQGESIRHQDVTSAQEKHTAARLAYERLLTDKNAVDMRLSKTEGERNELLAEVSTLRGRLEAEESARRQAEERCRQLEQQAWAPLGGTTRRGEQEGPFDIEGEASSSRGGGGGAGCKVLAPSVTETIRTLEHELGAERRQRLELEEKRDKFLQAVLSMNEHLVEHLNSPKKKKKKKLVKGTATSSSSSQRQTAGAGGSHTAARATARKKPVTAPSALSSSREKKPGSSAANVLLQLPFLPAPQKHTFNLLAALSGAVRQCKSKEPKQVLDALYEFLTSTEYIPDKTNREAFGAIDGEPAQPSPYVANSLSSLRRSGGALSKGIHHGASSQHILGDVHSSAAWSPPRGRTFPHSPQQHAGGEEEFDRLLGMLEEELGRLKTRHQEIVNYAKEGGGADAIDPEAFQGVLMDIQRKEQEVKLLRSCRRKATRAYQHHPATSPLVSPQAARRTSDRLSVLSGIKDLSELQDV